MSSTRDIDRTLDTWMSEGPSRVADRVIAAALTEIPTTRQRGARRTLRRYLSMTTLRPTAESPIRRLVPALAAAFLLIAVVGVVAVPRLLTIGDPGPGLADGTTFSSDRHGYELTLPEGWTMNEIPGEWRYGTVAAPFFPGTDEFASPADGNEVGLHVWAAEAPAGTTLDTFIESYDAQILSDLDCAPPVRQEPIAVAGTTGRVTGLSCTVEEDAIRIRETLFVANGTAYVVTMDTMQDEMTDSETDALYEAVLGTFRLAD
jgi:hypothetical protein